VLRGQRNGSLPANRPIAKEPAQREAQIIRKIFIDFEELFYLLYI
jgi:hypothetical protein